MILKKTTGRLHSLLMFLVFKYGRIVKIFLERVILLNHDVILHQKNNIIKLQYLRIVLD